MKIMICVAIQSYVSQEESGLAKYLAEKLRQKGNTVEVYSLPFEEDALYEIEQFTAYRLLDHKYDSDLLITIGYPAFLMSHSNKYSFLFSLNGMYYEQWKSVFGAQDSDPYTGIRSNVLKIERKYLGDAKRVFCASESLKRDLTDLHDINAGLFRFASGVSEKGSDLKDKNYFSVQTYLQPYERIDMVMDAFHLANTNAKLKIFIPKCQELMKKALYDGIKRLKLEDRTEVVQREMNITELLNSKAIFAFHHHSRRVPSCLMHAVNQDVPVIALKEFEAVAEIIKTQDTILECNLETIAKSIELLTRNSEKNILSKESLREIAGGIDDILKGITA